jgi:hypothetical protein
LTVNVLGVVIAIYLITEIFGKSVAFLPRVHPAEVAVVTRFEVVRSL